MDKQEQIVIYEAEDGLSSIVVQVLDKTVWLNRKQLSDLFDRDIKTLGNI